jgi:hypothetical protein
LPKTSIVDITKEVQETFLMYQNLFGNKIIDLNDETSPFKELGNLFSSTGKTNLGGLLLSRTKALGEKKQ